MSESKVVSSDTIKRLLKDVKYIIKNPLIDQGIYYIHDEADMLKGYTMIVGPSETPYFGGFYFFQFDFPTNYPFSPPKVTYMTNGENIRFNPNLYTNGKVCVSILNTWEGDKWSACQTINSVLLTLCSLLNNKPLLNEPGIKEDNPNLDTYNRIIEYSNISIAMCGMINKKYLPHEFELFYIYMKEHFLKNYEEVKAFINNKENVFYNIRCIYGLSINANYNNLKNELEKCYKMLQ